MKITREEFKALAALYNETWQLRAQYSAYLSEDLLDKLLFPAIVFVNSRLGLIKEDEEIDVLADLHTFGHVPVNIVYYRMPGGELDYTCEYTDDLDKIYDWYCSDD